MGVYVRRYKNGHELTQEPNRHLSIPSTMQLSFTMGHKIHPDVRRRLDSTLGTGPQHIAPYIGLLYTEGKLAGVTSLARRKWVHGLSPNLPSNLFNECGIVLWGVECHV